MFNRTCTEQIDLSLSVSFFKDLKFLCLGVKVAHGENHQELGRLTALLGSN